MVLFTVLIVGILWLFGEVLERPPSAELMFVMLVFAVWGFFLGTRLVRYVIKAERDLRYPLSRWQSVSAYAWILLQLACFFLFAAVPQMIDTLLIHAFILASVFGAADPGPKVLLEATPPVVPPPSPEDLAEQALIAAWWRNQPPNSSTPK